RRRPAREEGGRSRAPCRPGWAPTGCGAGEAAGVVRRLEGCQQSVIAAGSTPASPPQLPRLPCAARPGGPAWHGNDDAPPGCCPWRGFIVCCPAAVARQYQGRHHIHDNRPEVHHARDAADSECRATIARAHDALGGDARTAEAETRRLWVYGRGEDAIP